VSSSSAVALDSVGSFFRSLEAVTMWSYRVMDRLQITKAIVVIRYNVVYRVRPWPAA